MYKGRLFHLSRVDIHESVPVQSWNVLCFGGHAKRPGLRNRWRRTPFETFESEDVTKYMSARFDTTSTYCFNPFRHRYDGLRQDLYGG
jgi:hypothetical protein